MNIDWSQVAVLGIGGLVQLGAAGALLKYYASRVDKQSEIMPRLEQSFVTMDKAIESMRVSVEELYLSRNRHEKELTAIQTLHRYKGCDVSGGRNAHGDNSFSDSL